MRVLLRPYRRKIRNIAHIFHVVVIDDDMKGRSPKHTEDSFSGSLNFLSFPPPLSSSPLAYILLYQFNTVLCSTTYNDTIWYPSYGRAIESFNIWAVRIQIEEDSLKEERGREKFFIFIWIVFFSHFIDVYFAPFIYRTLHATINKGRREREPAVWRWKYLCCRQLRRKWKLQKSVTKFEFHLPEKVSEHTGRKQIREQV